MKNNDFIIKNKLYYWMTMNEMLNDKNIKRKEFRSCRVCEKYNINN